jgi:DNA-binding CsgD family transcriptional regulator
MPSSWPFVGRAEQLARIAHAVGDGDPAYGVVIRGPAGVGKSRLLAAAVADLRGDGAFVLTGRAMTALELPFGAFLELRVPDPVSGYDAPDQVLWALTELRTRAGSRRVVIAVDDLHLLNPLGSLLLDRMVASGMALIASQRAGTPLPALIDELCRDERLRILDLPPLDRDATAELLSQVLGGQVAGGTVTALWRLSRGHPLLLKELLNTLRASGELCRRQEIWRWSGQMSITPDLTRLVLGTIERIPRDVRTVIEIVAVGEPIDLDLLCAITSHRSVERAEERQYVEMTRDGPHLVVRAAHPLYSEAIRALTPAVRLRRHQATLADLVEGRGSNDPHELVRIAVWRLDSATGCADDLMLRAARLAYAGYNMPLAARLAEGAVARGGGSEAIVLWATALGFSEHPQQAVELLDRTAGQHQSDTERAQWALARAVQTFAGLDDPSTPDRLAAVAAELTNPTWRAYLRAHDGPMRVWRGDFTAGEDIVRSVLDDQATDPTTRLFVRAFLALLSAHRGHTTDARRIVDEVYRTAPEQLRQMPYLRNAVDQARIAAMLLVGDLSALAPMDDQARSGTTEVDESMQSFPLLEGQLMLGHAQALRMAGQADRARRAAAEALTHLHASGRVFLSVVHAEIAHATALMGDNEAAARSMSESDRSHRGTMQLMYPWIELARIHVDAAAGRADTADQHARTLAHRLRDDGLLAFEVQAWYVIVRYGRTDSSVTGRLTELAGQVDGPLVDICMRHAQAMQDQDPEMLRAVTADHAEHGLDLYAAEAAAQALRLLLNTASDQIAEGAAALADILARGTGHRTAALILSLPPLSARERQIVNQAAKGQTTASIGGKLFVSPRTVEQHLRRVYARWGVHRRTDLTLLHRITMLLEN